MDAFFASVEQLDNPEYKSKPVIVGADPRQGSGRGVVAASSYEARKFGIFSAMPISSAYKRCPNGIFLRPRFDRYKHVSKSIFEILESISQKIETISIDEAFLDCSHLNLSLKELPEAQVNRQASGFPEPQEELGYFVKDMIRQKVGLTCSVGIASSRSIAKICSGMNKPNGLMICPDGAEKDFLAPLPAQKLWGVGEKTKSKLEKYGIKTIGDIASVDSFFLTKEMGKWGQRLWELANGIDNTPVQTNRERKSLSKEKTFLEDTNDPQYILDSFKQLAQGISRQMKAKDISARTITLKIRYENFETLTRDKTLDFFTNETDKIFFTVKALYDRLLSKKKRVRLIGVRVSHLKEGKTFSQLEFTF